MREKIGEKYISKEGYKLTIIDYINNKNCTIQIKDGAILYNKTYINIRTGSVRNPYHPSVYGKGYLGVGEYKTTLNGKKTQAYVHWNNMLRRCYSGNFSNCYPTYSTCEVCKEWLNFQVFSKWFKNNYDENKMKGWELDKDILEEGNKLYSPSTCCFVPKELNKLFTENKTRNNEVIKQYDEQLYKEVIWRKKELV